MCELVQGVDVCTRVRMCVSECVCVCVSMCMCV